MLGVAERRKHYLQGTKRQLTPEWKDLVKATLAALGHNQQWLEGRIGAGAGSVSRMLHADAQVSGLVDVVCETLKIPPPMPSDPRESHLLSLWRATDPEDQEAVLTLLQRRKR